MLIYELCGNLWTLRVDWAGKADKLLSSKANWIYTKQISLIWEICQRAFCSSKVVAITITSLYDDNNASRFFLLFTDVIVQLLLSLFHFLRLAIKRYLLTWHFFLCKGLYLEDISRKLVTREMIYDDILLFLSAIIRITFFFLLPFVPFTFLFKDASLKEAKKWTKHQTKLK